MKNKKVTGYVIGYTVKCTSQKLERGGILHALDLITPGGSRMGPFKHNDVGTAWAKVFQWLKEERSEEEVKYIIPPSSGHGDYALITEKVVEELEK